MILKDRCLESVNQSLFIQGRKYIVSTSERLLRSVIEKWNLDKWLKNVNSQMSRYVGIGTSEYGGGLN